MGNKQQMQKGQRFQRSQAAITDIEEQQPSQFSSFNCMAMTPACCVNDELQKYEIDNSGHNGSTSNLAILENSIMQRRKNSEARFSQQFLNQMIDGATNGTENLILSDDDEEEDEEDGYGPVDDQQLDCFSADLQRKENQANRLFSQQSKGPNSVYSASRSKNTALKILDARSSCFNNRNKQIVWSTCGKKPLDQNIQAAIEAPKIISGYQTHRQRRASTMAVKKKITYSPKVPRSSRKQPKGAAEYGADYDTDKSLNNNRRPSAIRRSGVCLTEVDQSVGDSSHPEIEPDDDEDGDNDQGGLCFNGRGGRGPPRRRNNDDDDEYSPNVRDVPIDLRDLDRDESEEDEDQLEVRSIRSVRLYNGDSPGATRPNQRRMVQPYKQKVAANHAYKSSSSTLYPELTKLRPVKKEKSRAKEEFKRLTTSTRSKATPLGTRPGKTHRNLINPENLPQEIRDYLERSKKRYPTITIQNGSIYVGKMANAKQHGFGFCQAPNMAYYFGHWSEGKRHGEGQYCMADATVYQGTWVDDKLHGQGSCHKVNGTSYEGEWLNHQHHGKGKKTFPDKSSYVGSFINGKKHGHGVLKCPDGGVYDGQFANDLINGQGVYTWPGGIQYTGNWLDNKKHGYGRLRWLDGSREYEGEFRCDERHGQGTYTWEHGAKHYRGLWRNGQKDGVGFVRDEYDYLEKKGLWFCGKLVKWMPNEAEDEGQDGESINTQDIVEWEENNSPALRQSQKQQARPTDQNNTAQQEEEAKVAKEESKQQQQQQQQLLTLPKVDKNQVGRKTENNLISQLQISSQPPLDKHNKGPEDEQPGETTMMNQSRITSKSRLSGQLGFSRQSEQVKRLTVKRKQITKRVTETDKPVVQNPERFVPQMSRGMLPLQNRVSLIAGKELPEFVNQPPVEQIQLVHRESRLNDSGDTNQQSKYADNEIEIVDEDGDDVEYFQFTPVKEQEGDED